jgi:hypothetical protein
MNKSSSPRTIWIKRLQFVETCLIPKYFNRGQELDRLKLCNVLISGMPALTERFKWGFHLTDYLYEIPLNLIVNPEDLLNAKYNEKRNGLVGFSNPIKWTNWPNPELQERLRERNENPEEYIKAKPWLMNKGENRKR